MKRVLFAVIFLFTITNYSQAINYTLFEEEANEHYIVWNEETETFSFPQEKPQEKPKLTPEQEKLQKEFTELNQKLVNLKAQVYDAEQFVIEAKKQMIEIANKMNELNTQYQATLKKEKKNETP